MQEFVNKSAVLHMLHEAYADGVISTNDGCRALYKRLDDMPAADVQPIVYAHKTINVGMRSYCSNCGKLAIMEDFCSKCGAKVLE